MLLVSKSFRKLRQYGPNKKQIGLAGNLTAANDELKRKLPTSKDKSLKIACISRIVKMKNFVFSFHLLSKVSVPVEFMFMDLSKINFTGRIVLKLASKLPTNIKFKYCGSLDYDEVKKELVKYDLFLLPTLGENFGHVIFEALSVGTPVLISNKTPWNNLTQEGVGWDLPLTNVGKYVEVIEDLYNEPFEARSNRNKRCLAFARKKKKILSILRNIKNFFHLRDNNHNLKRLF